jgi:hypothetical protein
MQEGDFGGHHHPSVKKDQKMAERLIQKIKSIY